MVEDNLCFFSCIHHHFNDVLIFCWWQKSEICFFDFWQRPLGLLVCVATSYEALGTKALVTSSSSSSSSANPFFHIDAVLSHWVTQYSLSLPRLTVKFVCPFISLKYWHGLCEKRLLDVQLKKPGSWRDGFLWRGLTILGFTNIDFTNIQQVNNIGIYQGAVRVSPLDGFARDWTNVWEKISFQQVSYLYAKFCCHKSIIKKIRFSYSFACLKWWRWWWWRGR